MVGVEVYVAETVLGDLVDVLSRENHILSGLVSADHCGLELRPFGF
jgi:hypothetical protein